MDSLNNINLNGNKITKAGGITGGDASPSKVFYADGSIKSPLSNVVSGISIIYRDKWARVVKFGDSFHGTYIITIQYIYFNLVRNESFFVSFSIYTRRPTIIQLNSSQYNTVRNLKLRVLSPWKVPSAGNYLDIWFTDNDSVRFPNNPEAVNPEKRISVSILSLGYSTKTPQINTTFEEAEDLDESSPSLTYKGVDYGQNILTTDESHKSLMKAEMFVADEFKGDLTGTANKATGDGNGNNIASTYIKNLQIANKTLTATKGDGGTVDIGTIPTKYVLPIASSSELGGIKVGSNLSINSSTGVLSATNTTYSQGNSNTLGLTKLYTSTGSNTNGTMTQKAVTEELIPLTNLRRWVEKATSLQLHNLIFSKVQSTYWKDALHFIQRSTLEGTYELNLITLFSKLNSYTGSNMDYRKDREWTWTILYTGKNGSKFNIIGQNAYAAGHGIIAGDTAVLRFVYKTADDNNKAALICEASVGTWSCSCFVE